MDKQRARLANRSLSVVLPRPQGDALTIQLDRLLEVGTRLQANGFVTFEIVLLDLAGADEPPRPPIQIGPVQLFFRSARESTAALFQRAIRSARGDLLCVASDALAAQPSLLVSAVEAWQASAAEVVCIEATQTARYAAAFPQVSAEAARAPTTSALVACLGPTPLLTQLLDATSGELSSAALQSALKRTGIEAQWVRVLAPAVAVTAADQPPHLSGNPSVGRNGLSASRKLSRANLGRGFADLLARLRQSAWISTTVLALMIPVHSYLPAALLYGIAWVWVCSVAAAAALRALHAVAASSRAASWRGAGSPEATQRRRQVLLRQGLSAAALGAFAVLGFAALSLAPNAGNLRWMFFAVSLVAVILGLEFVGLALLLDTTLEPSEAHLDSSSVASRPPQHSSSLDL